MGNLQAAIDFAMACCWDESHGYSSINDGTDHMGHPDYDCSGLVGRALYEAGYNYPSTHVGTGFMKPDLITAGFTILPMSTLTQLDLELKPGDIVVMNHLDWTGGHTFFYMEDVRAYTDPNGVSNNIDIVHRVKIEAASRRGRPETEFGDTTNPAGNPGAYWQVWVHKYDGVSQSYDPTDPNNEVYIARDPMGLNPFIFGRSRRSKFRNKLKRRGIII